MNNKVDPNIFDQTFYSKMWPIYVAFFVCAPLFFVLLYFYGPELFAGKSIDWELYVAIPGLGLFVVSALYILLFMRKEPAVGIGENGLFIRKVGTVFWGEIEGFSIGTIGGGVTMQKVLYIALHDPKAVFRRISCFNRVGISLLSQKKLFIPGGVVPIKLEKLQQILKKAHKKYTQD